MPELFVLSLNVEIVFQLFTFLVQFFRKQTRKVLANLRRLCLQWEAFYFVARFIFQFWIRDDQNESWYGHWFHQSHLLELLSFLGPELISCTMFQVKWRKRQMRERVNVFVFFSILNLSLAYTDRNWICANRHWFLMILFATLHFSVDKL